ncbi:MAG: enolase [Clostridia bacterium]|nr:enolase [Clostridia bacterium]
MEQYLNLISVPAIAAIVYWVINIIKYAVGDNEKFKKFIPLIAAGLGVVCGIICYYAVPSIIPAPNIVVAILIGGASGLTATGTNQIIKQLGKKDDDNEKSNN